jgi:YD repeat-containing protein
MSDLVKWKVHGPVKTLKTELAEWDLSQDEWGPARSKTSCIFRSDGNISARDSHNSDGSIAHGRYLYNEAGSLTETDFWLNSGPSQKSLYFYDEVERHIRTVNVDQDGVQREAEECHYDSAGRKTKVSFLNPHRSGISQAHSIEGSENFYSAPGAISLTIHYDERHQPIEGLFHDWDRRLISRVVFIRDSAGRLLSEENYMGEQGPYSELKKRIEAISTEDRECATAILSKLYSPTQAFMSTSYEYDANSRLIARSRLMSTLLEERSTFRYDDHGNPIEEAIEHNSRDAFINENEELQTTNENTRKQRIRFEYKYDALENWTECIVSSLHEPNSDFQRSNVERREISYYDRDASA